MHLHSPFRAPVSRNLMKFFRCCARPLFRFLPARDGATAVEFALIAPVFIAVLFAILEVAFFLIAQQTLQTAATTAGRLIMTGQAQNSAMTQSQFAAAVCPMVTAIISCSNLMINVQSYSSFTGASASAPTLTYNAQGQVTNNWSYNPGVAGNVTVVQLIYQAPVVNGPLGFTLANLTNGTALMMGVTAFRVEPY